MNAATLAFHMPGGMEMIIIAVIALLIFGRRLPDVARSVGKSIVEFKKGIREVKDDIEDGSRLPPPASKPRIEASPPAGVDSSGSGDASSVPAQSGSPASTTPDAPSSP